MITNFINRTKRYSFIGTTCLAILGCANSGMANIDFGIWSSDVMNDTCEVSQRLEQYWVSDQMNDLRKSSVLTLGPDKDSFLRNKHRDVDWHVLEYIVADASFSSPLGCQSSVVIEPSVDGSRAGVQYTYIFSFDRVEEFCRDTRFQHRLGRAAENALTSGIVRSCINPVSKQKSFDII